MPIPQLLHWETLTATDFQALDRGRCIVLVSCSPIEVHGPHLPLGTDIVESEGILEAVLSHLPARLQQGHTWLKLPPLYVGADAVPQAGSIHFSADTTRRVLLDLGRSLAAQGFKTVLLSNFHGSPRHFLALEDSCAQVSRERNIVMVSVFSLLLRQLNGGSLDPADLLRDVPGMNPADLVGDLHAGLLETALMLALQPTAVAPSARDLPRQTLNTWLQARGERALTRAVGEPGWPWQSWRAFRALARFFAEENYAGAPAAASREVGLSMLDSLGEKGAAVVTDLLDQKIAPEEWNTPLFRARFFFLNPLVSILADRLLGASRAIR